MHSKRADASAALEDPKGAGDSVARVDLSSLALIERDWRALEQRAHSFSQCFDYARVALAIAEEKGKRSFLITLRDNGTLSGVWGLTVETGWLHAILRPFSCGTNEEYGWPLLHDPTLADRAFRQAVKLADKADCLMVYNVRAHSVIDAAVRALPFPRRVEPILGLAIPAASYMNWADAEKRLKGAMRYGLRNRANRLAQQGKVTIGWCQSLQDQEAAMAFLFARKAQWALEKHKRSSWLGRPEVPEFFRRLVREIQRPLVAAVRLDGVPIAAAICLVGPRSLEYVITTFDPKYSTYSPGKLLIWFLAEWAIQRRLDFDFCFMVSDYKEEWPVERNEYVTVKVILTLRGRIPELREMIRFARFTLSGMRRRVKAFATRRPAPKLQ